MTGTSTETETGKISFLYTSWRGERSLRTVTPYGSLDFSSSEWHPEPQRLMTAFDYDKDAARGFALSDCDFANTPAHKGGRPQPYLATERGSLKAPLATARDDALREAADIARYACLVPPDGGSPTGAEADLCDVAAEHILSLRTAPAPVSPGKARIAGLEALVKGLTPLEKFGDAMLER